MWAERRKASQSNNSPRHNDQFAALPSEMNSSSLLQQSPVMAKSVETISSWKATHKNKFLTLSKSFQPVLDSMSLAHGNIMDVYDAGSSKEPPLVLIQDIHLNSEAQKNIAGLLQDLIDQKRVGLVGVEGAFELFDFGPFRAFADKKMTKDIADAFLNKKLLAAPSYVGVTSKVEPPMFLGIDDREHYRANVQAYLATVSSKAIVERQLAKEEEKLNEEKKKIFSPELQSLSELKTAYHRGNVGLGAYVKKLMTTKNQGIYDLSLEQFVEAYDMEQRIDFRKGEAERQIVLRKLTRLLNKHELSDLLAQSMAYRMGRIGFGAYYQQLKDLCESKGISLKATPAFDQYVRYVLLSDGIKVDSLFVSLEKLEENILTTWAKTPEEKDLSDQIDHLQLTQKLIEFSLTPQEWEKYKKLAARYDHPVAGLVDNSLSRMQIAHRQSPHLSSFERFYSEAEIRSQKMVENLLTTVLLPKSSRVLVVGGFHTPQISKALRERKISYVVVSPKITTVGDESGSAYLSVFAREKMPLDEIFKGERLFLSPTAVHCVSYELAVPLLAALSSLQRHLKRVVIFWHRTPLSVHVPPDVTSLKQYEISPIAGTSSSGETDAKAHHDKAPVDNPVIKKGSVWRLTFAGLLATTVVVGVLFLLPELRHFNALAFLNHLPLGDVRRVFLFPAAFLILLVSAFMVSPLPQGERFWWQKSEDTYFFESVPFFSLRRDANEDAGHGKFSDLPGYYREANSRRGVTGLMLLPHMATSDESPYASVCMKAINILGIDWTKIPEVQQNADWRKLAVAPQAEQNEVNYHSVRQREKILGEKVVEKFFEDEATAETARGRAFNQFINHHQDWLNGYADFAAISDITNQPWFDWDQQALQNARENPSYAQRIRFHQFTQWVAAVQLKEAVQEIQEVKGKVLFDLPMFRAKSSYDVWHDQNAFNEAKTKNPGIRGFQWGDLALWNWSTLRQRHFRPILEPLRYWLDFGFDGARLDALHFAYNMGQHHANGEPGDELVGAIAYEFYSRGKLPLAEAFEGQAGKIREKGIVTLNDNENPGDHAKKITTHDEGQRFAPANFLNIFRRLTTNGNIFSGRAARFFCTTLGDPYFNHAATIKVERDGKSFWRYRIPSDRRDFLSTYLSLHKEKIPAVQQGHGSIWDSSRQVQHLLEAVTYSFVKRGDGNVPEIWAASRDWFEQQWGRDTFIAMTGVLLATSRFSEARELIQSFARFEKNGLIPNRIWDPNNQATIEYNTADASMLFISAINDYVRYTGDWDFVKSQSSTIRRIIESYRLGTGFDSDKRVNDDAQKNIRRIFMDTDGLISSPSQATWMDADPAGRGAVTPRDGKTVEINALWYSNLRFLCVILAEAKAPPVEIQEYAHLADRVRDNFRQKFWDTREKLDENGKLENRLLDVVDSHDRLAGANRPNQLMAISHGGDLLTPEMRAGVMSAAHQYLITPYGPRTLDPRTVGDYWWHYNTHQEPHPNSADFHSHKDYGYHQGTVWPWLMGPYIDSLVIIRREHGISWDEIRTEIRQRVEPLLWDFLFDGSIHEVYDAEPRHGTSGRQHPGGNPSQAWSVAEVYRVLMEYGVLTDGKFKGRREAAVDAFVEKTIASAGASTELTDRSEHTTPGVDAHTSGPLPRQMHLRIPGLLPEHESLFLGLATGGLSLGVMGILSGFGFFQTGSDFPLFMTIFSVMGAAVSVVFKRMHNGISDVQDAPYVVHAKSLGLAFISSLPITVFMLSAFHQAHAPPAFIGMFFFTALYTLFHLFFHLRHNAKNPNHRMSLSSLLLPGHTQAQFFAAIPLHELPNADAWIERYLAEITRASVRMTSSNDFDMAYRQVLPMDLESLGMTDDNIAAILSPVAHSQKNLLGILKAIARKNNISDDALLAARKIPRQYRELVRSLNPYKRLAAERVNDFLTFAQEHDWVYYYLKAFRPIFDGKNPHKKRLVMLNIDSHSDLAPESDQTPSNVHSSNWALWALAEGLMDVYVRLELPFDSNGKPVMRVVGRDSFERSGSGVVSPHINTLNDLQSLLLRDDIEFIVTIDADVFSLYDYENVGASGTHSIFHIAPSLFHPIFKPFLDVLKKVKQEKNRDPLRVMAVLSPAYLDWTHMTHQWIQRFQDFITETFPDPQLTAKAAAATNIFDYLISEHDLNHQAMFHPKWGYYAGNRVNLGVDFDTVPMLMSPHYGAMVCEQVFTMWKGMRKAGQLKENKFYVAEVAAGSGVLASDFLTHAKQRAEMGYEGWEAFFNTLVYEAVELSSRNMDRLKSDKANAGFISSGKLVPHQENLNDFLERRNKQPVSGVVLSNEFFDATAYHVVKLSETEGMTVSAMMATIDESDGALIAEHGLLPADTPFLIDSESHRLALPRDAFFKLKSKIEEPGHEDIRKSLRGKIMFNPVHFEANNYHDLKDYVLALSHEMAKAMVRHGKDLYARISPEHGPIMKRMLNCLTHGYVLSIDYGISTHERWSPTLATGRTSYGQILQARSKEPQDSFLSMGHDDMTASPDLTYLAQAGREVGADVVLHGHQSALGNKTGINLESHESDLMLFKRLLQRSIRIVKETASKDPKNNPERIQSIPRLYEILEHVAEQLSDMTVSNDVIQDLIKSFSLSAVDQSTVVGLMQTFIKGVDAKKLLEVKANYQDPQFRMLILRAKGTDPAYRYPGVDKPEQISLMGEDPVDPTAASRVNAIDQSLRQQFTADSPPSPSSLLYLVLSSKPVYPLMSFLLGRRADRVARVVGWLGAALEGPALVGLLSWSTNDIYVQLAMAFGFVLLHVLLLSINIRGNLLRGSPMGLIVTTVLTALYVFVAPSFISNPTSLAIVMIPHLIWDAFVLSRPQFVSNLSPVFKQRRINSQQKLESLLVDVLRQFDSYELSTLIQQFGPTSIHRYSVEQIIEAIRQVGMKRLIVDGKYWKGFYPESNFETGAVTGRIHSFKSLHDRGTSHAAIYGLLITPRGRVVSQIGHNGIMDLSAGGHIELGHTPEQSAVLELNEELGLEAMGIHLSVEDGRRFHFPDGKPFVNRIEEATHDGASYVDPNGIYRCYGTMNKNHEQDYLVIFEITESEADRIEAYFKSHTTEEVQSVAVASLHELLATFNAFPDSPLKQTSGFAEFFSDAYMRHHMLTELTRPRGVSKYFSRQRFFDWFHRWFFGELSLNQLYNYPPSEWSDQPWRDFPSVLLGLSETTRVHALAHLKNTLSKIVGFSDKPNVTKELRERALSYYQRFDLTTPMNANAYRHQLQREFPIDDFHGAVRAFLTEKKVTTLADVLVALENPEMFRGDDAAEFYRLIESVNIHLEEVRQFSRQFKNDNADSRLSHSVGSIYDPIVKLILNWLNPMVFPRGFINFGLTVVLSSIWETKAFHDRLYLKVLVYFFQAGHTQSTTIFLSMSVVAIVFSLAHTMAEWLFDSNQGVRSRNFVVRAMLSFVFSYPFIHFAPAIAGPITIFLHGFYNAYVLYGRVPSWLRPYLVVASFFSTSGAPVDRKHERRVKLEKELADLQAQYDQIKNHGLPRAVYLGDLHGDAFFLERVWELVERGEVDEVIFHGDLFDRGSQNMKCLELIEKIQNKLGERFISLMGNHDAVLVEGILLGNVPMFAKWAKAGGIAFLSELGLDDLGARFQNTISPNGTIDLDLVKPLQQEASKNPSLRRAAFWILKNARFYYRDSMDYNHVHAGFRLSRNGELQFDFYSGDDAWVAIESSQSAWRDLQASLKGDALTAQEIYGIQAAMSAASSLYWDRRRDWYIHLLNIDQQELNRRVDSLFDQLAPEKKAIYRAKGFDDQKIKNRLAVRVLNDMEVGAPVHQGLLHNALKQLGHARGIFFGHEHKRDLVVFGKRIFCLDADEMKTQSGLMRLTPEAMTWVTRAGHSSRVFGKEHFMADILRDIVVVKEKLRLQVTGDLRRLKKIKAREKRQARLAQKRQHVSWTKLATTFVIWLSIPFAFLINDLRADSSKFNPSVTPLHHFPAVPDFSNNKFKLSDLVRSIENDDLSQAVLWAQPSIEQLGVGDIGHKTILTNRQHNQLAYVLGSTMVQLPVDHKGDITFGFFGGESVDRDRLLVAVAKAVTSGYSVRLMGEESKSALFNDVKRAVLNTFPQGHLSISIFPINQKIKSGARLSPAELRQKWGINLDQTFLIYRGIQLDGEIKNTLLFDLYLPPIEVLLQNNQILKVLQAFGSAA